MSTNFLNNLDEFVAKWDNGDFASSNSVNEASDRGELNTDGTLGNTVAFVFTKNDPRFWTSVEPRVRALVKCMIQRFDCITYSSCEGHPASRDIPYKMRHVGILPRDDVEFERCLSMMKAAVAKAAGKSKSGCVEIAVVEDQLNSELTSRPCIDLWFRACCSDITKYFEQVDIVTRDLVSILETDYAAA